MASEEKEREVRRLLWDLPAWWAAFGGGVGYDTMKAMGQHGPAGIVFTGAEFRDLTREEKRLLRRSMHALLAASRALRLAGDARIGEYGSGDPMTAFDAWARLVEPYLGDPADPSLPDEWRRKAARGSVVAGRFVEEHDAAVRWLAEYLKDTDLYAVFPKLMSEDEEKKMEHTNDEICAVYFRLMHAGASEKAALKQTSQNFHGLPTDRIVRILEVRARNRPERCVEEGCEAAVFASERCQAHYQARYRERKKRSGKTR